MIDYVNFNGLLFAIVVKNAFNQRGIKFFTDEKFSQQLGYMNRPSGHIIKPHTHNFVERNIQNTQEVLFIKSGKVRIDFYDSEKEYLESRILYKGDVILLASGGHGFEMLEDSEIIEVKQGPYSGEDDKVCFSQVENKKIRIIE
jgi:hypothetical protein